jgi:hypothetical protein
MQGDQKGDRLPFATAPKDILEKRYSYECKKSKQRNFLLQHLPAESENCMQH